ncbi:heavy metal translocating P-type ATPase [Halomarina pelagica]|uniref:heavy metal translocating P-type ATPase n=1 Tax=Halomarina pelagica TaxID=2961599 RepID=UPI00211482FC|nr:heavy metal translocating P-type ATPase [Halomarina sp. BND7]
MSDKADRERTPADSNRTPERSDGRVVRLSVPEMDCPSCAGKVTGSVERLDGVRDLDPRPATGTLVVEYDPAVTDAAAIGERVESAGYRVEPDAEAATVRFSVPGMDCPSCAGAVEKALERVEGVEASDPRPATGTVVVTYDPERVSTDRLAAAIEGAGYEVAGREGDDDAGDSESVWRSPRAIKTWLSGAFVAFGLLFEFLLPGADVAVATVLGSTLHVADVLFLLAVAAGGQEIVRNGYYSARTRSLDIDLLMSVAILGALVASVAFGEALYFEAATLAFLFSVAELLERYSMDRARNSLRELMDLSPAEATVRRDTGTSETSRADGEAADGQEVTVPVEEVAVGETVLVRPGEQIPLDGEVIEGSSAVNQSPITGESVPVDKAVGDEVYAGTINQEGYLEVRTTAAADDTTLAHIVRLVEDAQADRTEREQFVDRFANWYTPTVVLFAVLVAVVPPLALGASWVTYLVYGLTLLVLACPCAFVISTPVSVVSGITSAANNGVLIKGGSYLEAMGAIDVVAFDKTGTLTTGDLAVTDVVPLNGNTAEDVLRCARGLEARSEHPVAQAIVARAEGVGSRDVSEFESLTGRGVRADLDGTTHYAGKPGLFEELGFDLSHVHATTDGGVVTRTATRLCERNDCLDLLEDTVPALQAEGKTVVLVGTEDELEGVVAVADEVRPEARRTVARLKELGVSRTVMLTGDNERTARAIADRVGVDDVRAGLLPDQKVDAIEELTEQFDGVAMVGDGINDAPALATATVGIAMGAAGTDTALDTADIALMGDDLAKLPYLYRLSHTATRVIRQNVWLSLGAKAALALGVPFGLVPIWAAVLLGDAGMTVGVTGNAMRLSRIEPEPVDRIADGATN